jgi:hypothetical protein
MSKPLRVALVALAAALAMPIAAHAQWWQRHPAYLRAMSDLRTAYWLIQHRDSMDPVAVVEEGQALRAIRAAYQDLKDASIVDSKDINDQPPPDTNFFDHRGRLHHALDLLHDAHDRVSGEEDDPAARGLRARAIRDIDAAGRATDAAIHAGRF